MKNLLLLIVFFQITLTAVGQINKGVNLITFERHSEYAANETALMKKYLDLGDNKTDSVLQINKAYFFKISQLEGLQLKSEERTRYLEKALLTWEENLIKILGRDVSRKYFDLQSQKQKVWCKKQNLISSGEKQNNQQ